jgi:hypothetical protein
MRYQRIQDLLRNCKDKKLIAVTSEALGFIGDLAPDHRFESSTWLISKPGWKPEMGQGFERSRSNDW